MYQLIIMIIFFLGKPPNLPLFFNYRTSSVEESIKSDKRRSVIPRPNMNRATKNNRVSSKDENKNNKD